MYCNQCGKELTDNSKFCNYCGARLEQDSKNIKEINPKKVNEKKDNNKNFEKDVKKYNNWATMSFVFGLLSMFIYSIGIIPIFGVIASILGLINSRYIKGKYKTFLIIGTIFSFIYFTMFLFYRP
jgi:hypothetical protein